MPAGHQPVPEYSEASPDIVPQDWAGGECYPADCSPGWCAPCDPCFSPLHERLWVRGEYLLWWTQGSGLPPLVTTSPVGTTPDVAGVLGQPGTAILFGDETVNTDAHSGGRLRLGLWHDSCHCAGIEASYLGIGRQTTSFAASSPDTPIIARPYFDTLLGAQSAMLVAHPDFLRGSISVEAATELQSVEILLRRNLFLRPCDRMDFLLGWRFARLDESLRINQFSEWTEAQGLIPPGTTKTLVDRFDVASHFYGAQLGVVYQERVGCWSVEMSAKLALGNTRSLVAIDGLTTTATPDGNVAAFAGGLLAQPTNIGRYEDNHFAVIPELGMGLRFGYTFLYWSRVARPASQIDTSVSQLPPEDPTGARRPAFAFSTSDFWAQGINFGLEYRF